ncbi:hypothetical protein [Spartinivicinus ruber]|uniref:hypothetical protein n=1 Tax=Spartinivicinus ruber TaxID=2683272 RepID=UPI0013D45013|nr:hypothetical protein [Spartinivicinus ruber]
MLESYGPLGFYVDNKANLAIGFGFDLSKYSVKDVVKTLEPHLLNPFTSYEVAVLKAYINDEALQWPGSKFNGKQLLPYQVKQQLINIRLKSTEAASTLLENELNDLEKQLDDLLGDNHQLPASKERIAVISLLKESVETKGELLKDSIKSIKNIITEGEGDPTQRARLWSLIKYQSNTEKSHLVQETRDQQAELFSLYEGEGEPTSDEEAKAVIYTLTQQKAMAVSYFVDMGLGSEAHFDEHVMIATDYLGGLDKTIIGADSRYKDSQGNSVDDKDKLIGTEGDDLIYGQSGVDEILAGEGDDDVFGGAGNDIIKGEDGFDSIEGGEGNDILLGGNGEDAIEGDLGDDIIIGGAESDELSGGEGNDIISGCDGRDSIYGGEGNDIFIGGQGDDIIDLDGGDICIVSPDSDHDSLYGSKKGGDTVLFTGGIQPEQVFKGVIKRGDSVVLTALGANAKLTWSSFFPNSDDYEVNRITFENGFTINSQEVLDIFSDTADKYKNILKLRDFSKDNLWFSQQDDNLQINVIGSNDQFIIEDWYSSYKWRQVDVQVDVIETNDHLLVKDDIEVLVQAMAAFNDYETADGNVTAEVQASLAPVLSAAWQPKH